MADDPEPDVDELEPESSDELDPEPEPEPEPEPDRHLGETGEQHIDRVASRASKRITAQQEELRRRDQQIADLNKRLDSVLAQSQQPRPTQETAEQREQRLALLDPVERMRVEMQESQQASQRQMQMMAFTFQDSGDKASFEAKALIDPVYAKWAPKVESFLADLRSKGQNVAREQALKYLIGEAALANRKTSTGKQRAAAAGRMARNKTSPSNSRSDTQGERRGGSDDAAAREKRLENVQI